MTQGYINGPDPAMPEPQAIAKWAPYTGLDDLPLDEPILFELEGSNQHTLQVGTAWKNNSGQRLGRIGDRFHFDCKPVRWVGLNELLKLVR